MSNRFLAYWSTMSILLAATTVACGSPQEPPATPPVAWEKQIPAEGPEVAVEMRLISVPDAVWERLGVVLGKVAPAAEPTNGAASQPMFLNDRELGLLMEAIQGDSRASVMAAPKLTVFSGQTGNFAVADQQFFVTGVNVVQAGGQQVFVPKNEQLKTGLQLEVTPTISADRKFVRIASRAEVAQLDAGPVPLYPVVTYVTPVFEGGAVGQPVPFTQYIQQPKISRLRSEFVANVPDGGTALMYAWKKPGSAKQPEDGSVLSKIPYVNRLFKNVAYAAENENVLLMVTPRILVNEEDEHRIIAQVVPTAAPPQAVPVAVSRTRRKVVDLLSQYQAACAEGRLDDAKKLARRALTLDPTCFSRNEPASPPPQPLQR
jgi:Flp pilus assembly secretin CpaC